jgi:hypothetical protein
MTQEESYKVFWLVKGHFVASHKTVMDSADGYFKRLWNNNERSEYGLEGFDEAYKKVLDKQSNISYNKT